MQKAEAFLTGHWAHSDSTLEGSLVACLVKLSHLLFSDLQIDWLLAGGNGRGKEATLTHLLTLQPSNCENHNRISCVKRLFLVHRNVQRSPVHRGQRARVINRLRS